MDLKERLEALAYELSLPYCFNCAVSARSGRCPSCHSDDLARLLPGVGADWGIDWVVRDLLSANVEPFDADAGFTEFVAEVYGETVTVAWATLDLPRTLREADEVSWDLAKDEWLSGLQEDGRFVTFDQGSTYFDLDAIEAYVREAES